MNPKNPSEPKRTEGLIKEKKEILTPRERSNSNLVHWPPGVSGNPNGQPKKFTSLLKEYGYNKAEINSTIENILAMNTAQLEMIKSDPDLTILEVTIIKAVERSIKYGSLHNLEMLLTRVYGQPKQEISHEIEIQPPLFPDLSKTKDELNG